MKIVARIMRGDRVESIHQAEAVIVDDQGKVVVQTEHPDYRTFTRSTVKPFQAFPLLASGAFKKYEIQSKELAVICASHNGEPIHIDTVRRLQKRTGLSEGQLLCGAHKPMDEQASDALARGHIVPTPIYNNCSGKHTGMLLAARYQQLSLEDYINPEHPLQRQITGLISDLIGRQDIYIGVDGCSAPTFYLTVREVAILFQKLADNTNKIFSTIFEAMSGEPYLVAGRGRFDTVVMQVLSGTAVSKVGAAGVRGMALRRDGKTYGLGLKVRDGSMEVSPTMLLSLLEYIGWLVPDNHPELHRFYQPEIRNYRDLLVGRIESEVVE
ncbi:MAG: asparaginase [Calditrichota bacterium]